MVDPIEVYCQLCCAAPGTPCSSPLTGEDQDPHPPRRRLAGVDLRCDECQRGYHIHHSQEWRPSVLDGEVVNGAGACLKCPCDWRA